MEKGASKPRKKSSKSGRSVSQSSEQELSSTEAKLIKQRLFTLTGSQDIRLNDPHYRDKMREKLQQEYERQQEKLEKEREEAERERMRRLLSRGIITAETLRSDPILSREYRLKHELNPDSKKKHKKRPKHRKASPQRVKSAPLYLTENNNKKRTSFSTDDSLVSKTRRPVTSTSRRKSSVTSSTSDRVSVDDRPTSTVSTRSRQENAIIRQMRDEESLDGLYRLASEIIRETEKEAPKQERDKTEEELALEEENKYKNKKVVIKVKF